MHPKIFGKESDFFIYTQTFYIISYLVLLHVFTLNFYIKGKKMSLY